MNQTRRCRMNVAPAPWIRKLPFTNSLQFAMRVGTAIGSVSAQLIGDAPAIIPPHQLAISETTRALSLQPSRSELATCPIQLI